MHESDERVLGVKAPEYLFNRGTRDRGGIIDKYCMSKMALENMIE
jgi:hypothetical protein